MNLIVAPQAKEQLSSLPEHVKKKAQKQFSFLIQNFRHPSLRARKMSGTDMYEARIDIHYRFSFIVEGETIYVLTIGPHDEGLGEK